MTHGFCAGCGHASHIGNCFDCACHSASAPPRPPPTREARFPFGRNSGKPIRGAAVENLTWLRGALVSSIADPSRARWKTQNAEVLAAVEAELASPTAGTVAS